MKLNPVQRRVYHLFKRRINKFGYITLRQIREVTGLPHPTIYRCMQKIKMYDERVYSFGNGNYRYKEDA